MPPKAGSRRGGATAPRRNDGTETTQTQQQQNPSVSSASPAPASTGTTPRPPVQRLQSLKKRAPPGSIGPGAGRPSPAPGPAGGEPAKPTLKYQPRAVGRRSKEEREKIEREEAKRNKERLAEAAAIQRGKASLAARGRAGFGGARGRGGGMMGGAAGPLGSGMAIGGARRGRGGIFGGGGDSRASSMSRRSRSVMEVGGGDGGAGGRGWEGGVSSDEDDAEVRISIDRINLDSDADEDEDEKEMVDQKKRWKGKMAIRSRGERGLRPIRVERHEHEERVVSVNMESSSSKSAELREQAKAQGKDDGDLFVRDDEEEEGGERAATPTGPRVKEEPTDENDQTMADVPHAEEPVTTDDGLLPAQTVKVRRKLGSREQSVVKEEESKKDPKSLLRTKEDIEEYDRHAKDLEEIKKLLSRDEATKEPTTKTDEAAKEGPDAGTAEDAEKSSGEGEEESEDKDKLSGQLFLVQFPPITPNLTVPGEEEQNAGGDSTPTEAPVPSAADLILKREDGVEVLEGIDESIPAAKPSNVITAGDWQLRSGRVGKLNVHASGRVTMDWGGISFELDRATEVNFLQEALIVSTPPNVAETEVIDDEHRVWAMGQLSGKFTVTPDWGKML